MDNVYKCERGVNISQMLKKIYVPYRDSYYELIANRTIYYMKKYHKFNITKTYYKPADFYVGECDIGSSGIVWCDKQGKNDTKIIDDRKIIVTTIRLKEYMEKNGINVEQVIPWGVDDELAQKHVNFDFNARKGYMIIAKNIPCDVLKTFERRRKQLTIISDHPNADFRPMDISENIKYYLLSHSLFYITIDDDIYPIEAMSVGTPLVYIKRQPYTGYECGIEIDSIEDLRTIGVSREEWEDLSWKCWFKSLRYHYITIGQELWGWLK